MEKVRNKITDLIKSEKQLDLIGKCGFYGYYAIMVIVKTFGFVSYETFFKIAFAIAIICLGIKLVTTKYTMREFLILYLLLAVSAICWLRVGEKNVLFITLTLMGIKNCNFESLMKLTVGIRALGTSLMILFATMGLIDIQMDDSIAADYSHRTVYAFGYTEANAAFYIFVLAIAVLLYINYEKINMWYLLVTAALAYAMFSVTFCRTGILIFIGMWSLILLDKLCRKFKKYYFLMSFSIAGLFTLSFIGMVTYLKANRILFMINRLLNGRIEITNNYYEAYGISLFPKDVTIFWNMNYTVVDNLYMYLFISCGVIVSVLYVFFATKSMLKLYRQGYYKEILFITAFAVYAVLEQSPFNPILNPFVLLMGNLIYRDFEIREKHFE